MATAPTRPPTRRSERRNAHDPHRRRDEGRATFQPTEATEIAVKRLMLQSATLTRTAAVRMLADLGARQATYDALRAQRVNERKAAFAEMVSALADPITVDDAGWDAAVLSLRGGAHQPDDGRHR